MSTRSNSANILSTRIPLSGNVNLHTIPQNGLFFRLITESAIYKALDIDLAPYLKRIFDFLLSGFGLTLSSWLWVVIAILILLEDGFPVIIRQRRIGKHGRIFTSFKFRSMVKSTLMEMVNSQAAEYDHRVTRIGKWLRASALDELPQLLNILFGDMSFVGPRPLLPNEIELNGDLGKISVQEITGYEKRVSISPGLTGIAQIFAPRDIPRKHKFKYDLLYIRKMNLLFDIQLVILSFLITFKGAWEKRCAKLEVLKSCNR
jgi:lipopolysaccharide/colanic/teichoic acid biosynthesis glycosyltransferase